MKARGRTGADGAQPPPLLECAGLSTITGRYSSGFSRSWIAVAAIFDPTKILNRMNDTNTSAMGAAPARPTLLTVICIISFIMGAFGIYSGIRNLTMDPAAERAKLETAMGDQVAKIGGNANEMTNRLMESAHEVGVKGIDNARPIGIAGIVLSLLSVSGVWLMWNLKKSGFWLYLLATIGGLVVPLIFLGGGWLALASVGFVGFFSLIFIILYAVNLKYMH